MTKELNEKKKQVIGLYGEMQLALELHSRGWQVHRAYIDEGIDFVITKYWCSECRQFSGQYIRSQQYNKGKNNKGKNVKCVTNLCNKCEKTNLGIVSGYLQVKTSEGISTKNNDIRHFSFHPKIRYDLGKNVFYVWVAVFEDEEEFKNTRIHYYIFNTKDVEKFDKLDLPTYQITDNQKTELPIRRHDGVITRKGHIHDYKCFKDFHNNFEILDKLKMF